MFGWKNLLTVKKSHEVSSTSENIELEPILLSSRLLLIALKSP